MRPGLQRWTTAVWAALVAITLTAYAMGLDADNLRGGVHVATTGILVLALTKVRIIMRSFMEVGSAPAVLRWVCDGWIAAVGALLLTIYWMAVSGDAAVAAGYGH